MKNYRISIILFIAMFFMATTIGASPLPEKDANRYDNQVYWGSSTATPTAKLSEYTKLILDYIASQKNIPFDRLLSINEHRRAYPDLSKSYWYVKGGMSMAVYFLKGVGFLGRHGYSPELQAADDRIEQ